MAYKSKNKKNKVNQSVFKWTHYHGCNTRTLNEGKSVICYMVSGGKTSGVSNGEEGVIRQWKVKINNHL
jgi:hypothetical protein